MLYFDNASSAKLHPVLKDAFTEEIFRYEANPSSFHRAGIQVQKRLTWVKQQMATHIKCHAQELTFTSGGTESNNLALRGVLSAGDHVITSAYEHPSIRSLLHEMEKSLEVTWLKEVSEQSVLQAIQPNTRLVSIMHVNNETGQIFALDPLYKKLKQKGILLHRDAVQSFMKVPFQATACDMASFSAHKVGALKGLGVLYKRKELKLKPMMWGGEQQLGLRPGTENVPGILALGLVLEAKAGRLQEDFIHVSVLNRYLRERLAKQAVLLSEAEASPYILSISVPGVPSEIVLNALSEQDIFLSAGSACSSKSQHRSYVIEQLVEDEAIRQGVLRLSFSEWNTMEEAEQFIQSFETIVPKLRKVIR